MGISLVSKWAELLPAGLEAISVLGPKLPTTQIMTLVLAFSVLEGIAAL